MESRRDEIYLLAILFVFPSSSPHPTSLSISLSNSSSCFVFPAPCWLARLQTRGTPEIQISWHLFGRTRQAAYASQVTCTQTCNLQIINVVLISHINSCHFVGIVSPRRSPGLLPAMSASETARAVLLLRSESRASEERRAAGWCTHSDTHTHTHPEHIQATEHTPKHNEPRMQSNMYIMWLVFIFPPYGHMCTPTHQTNNHNMSRCMCVCACVHVWDKYRKCKTLFYIVILNKSHQKTTMRLSVSQCFGTFIPTDDVR